jgi:hypothetical protein
MLSAFETTCWVLGLLVQAVLIGGWVRRLRCRCDFRLSYEDTNEITALLCRKKVQATLVIRDLTLRVFAITRFRETKPWENCTVILQSPCTVVAWLCGARTSVSHLTSISVRGSVELASPVDVERSSFIFKAMGKRSSPNCDKNGCKCKKQRKAVTWRKNDQLFTLRVFVLRDDFSERINRVIRGFAVHLDCIF